MNNYVNNIHIIFKQKKNVVRVTNSKAWCWLALLSKADNVHWELVWGSGKSGGNLAIQKREGQGEGSGRDWLSGNIYHQTLAIHLKSVQQQVIQTKIIMQKLERIQAFMLQQKEKYVLLVLCCVFWTNVILTTLKKTKPKNPTGKGHQRCKAKLSGHITIKTFHAVLI